MRRGRGRALRFVLGGSLLGPVGCLGAPRVYECPPPINCNCVATVERPDVPIWPDVPFERGSAELSRAAREALDRFVRGAQEFTGIYGVRIVGYDDGGPSFDARLAEARATAVAQYFVTLGVPRELIRSSSASADDAWPAARVQLALVFRR